MGCDEPVRQQVEAQVDVVGVDGRVGERLDDGRDGHALDAAARVGPERGGDVDAEVLDAAAASRRTEPGDAAPSRSAAAAVVAGGERGEGYQVSSTRPSG